MRKLEKGFTLIELMIVVAIIAILAAVAAPRFGLQLKKAQDAKAIQIVGNWRAAATMYYSDNQKAASNWGDLEDSVDTNTQDKTFKEDGSAKYTATEVSASAIAGTGAAGVTATAGKEIAKFYIVTSGTETNINFTSSDVDTKNTSWSAY